MGRCAGSGRAYAEPYQYRGAFQKGSRILVECTMVACTATDGAANRIADTRACVRCSCNCMTRCCKPLRRPHSAWSRVPYMAVALCFSADPTACHAALHTRAHGCTREISCPAYDPHHDGLDAPSWPRKTRCGSHRQIDRHRGLTNHTRATTRTSELPGVRGAAHGPTPRSCRKTHASGALFVN